MSQRVKLIRFKLAAIMVLLLMATFSWSWSEYANDVYSVAGHPERFYNSDLMNQAAFGQGGRDPCANANLVTTSGAVTVDAVDTVMITGTSGRQISVCGLFLVSTNGSGTFRVQSGTGPACATGTANLTGVMFTTAGNAPYQAGPYGHLLFQSGVGRDICLDVGGGAPSFRGWIQWILAAP